MLELSKSSIQSHKQCEQAVISLLVDFIEENENETLENLSNTILEALMNEGLPLYLVGKAFKYYGMCR